MEENIQTPAENVTTTPVEPVKPKTNWGMPFLFLILGVALGAGGLWGYQKYFANQSAYPSPSPTPLTWQTYVSEKFGFSIQYPPDAKTSSREPDPFPVAVQIDNFQSGKEVRGFPIGWMIIISEPQPNPKNETLREWAKEKELSSTQALDTKIDNQPAIYWRTTGGDADLLFYLVKNNEKVLLITINPATGYEDTINQILSTFQFLQ